MMLVYMETHSTAKVKGPHFKKTAASKLIAFECGHCLYDQERNRYAPTSESPSRPLRL